jgi:hypothetical protein
MPVNVDEITSDVTAEAEPQTASTGDAPLWQEVERIRAAQSQIACDQWRTAAEGYDD